MYSQVGQKLWVTWGPMTWQLAPEVGGSVMGLQLDGVRIELNCRTPSWHHRELHGVGKKLTHLVSEVL